MHFGILQAKNFVILKQIYFIADHSNGKENNLKTVDVKIFFFKKNRFHKSK